MENAIRSERSRAAILKAALVVIARDGVHRLTLDAIARESGLSKGGVMHQFRTKDAVLKALLEQQMADFERYSEAFLAGASSSVAEPTLAAQIVTIREVMDTPNLAALAILSILTTDQALRDAIVAIDAKKIAKIKAEAADPDEALLKWSAARGLLFTTMMGLSPFSKKERDRLFDRLLAQPAKAKKR
jgi:AcrR family transcriptional regulator